MPSIGSAGSIDDDRRANRLRRAPAGRRSSRTSKRSDARLRRSAPGACRCARTGSTRGAAGRPVELMIARVSDDADDLHRDRISEVEILADGTLIRKVEFRERLVDARSAGRPVFVARREIAAGEKMRADRRRRSPAPTWSYGDRRCRSIVSRRRTQAPRRVVLRLACRRRCRSPNTSTAATPGSAPSDRAGRAGQTASSLRRV